MIPSGRGYQECGCIFFLQGGSFGRLVGLQGVEVFQKEEPRGLLRVIEFAGATGVFPEDITDVFEGLFEHGWLKSDNSEACRGSRAKKTKPPLSQIRLNEGAAVWHEVELGLKSLLLLVSIYQDDRQNLEPMAWASGDGEAFGQE